MKIVFFGTPDFAANILSFLFENNLNIVSVVTQPDIKKNNRIHASAVKKIAKQHLKDEDIHSPEKASDINFLNNLKKYSPDLFIVVAYGQILKQNLLDLPLVDCINVHASILPKYRGAAPIQHAILNGEKKTGITIMKMVRKMDAGPIILQKEIPIKEDAIFTDLEEELCTLSKSLLLETIKKYEKNEIVFTNQDESRVSFAPKITKETREIDFFKKAKQINDQVRAFANKPGAFIKILINDSIKELKIFKVKILNLDLGPRILKLEKDSLIIGCQKDAIELVDVQLEGKRRMKIQDLIRGLKGKISLQG